MLIGNAFIRILQLCVSILALLLNTAVIAILIFKSHTLGQYKPIVVHTTLFYIVYSTIIVVVAPEIRVYGSIYITLANPQNIIFNKYITCFFLFLYSGCFAFSMGNVALRFYYRYCTTAGSNLFCTPKNIDVSLWFLFPLGFGVMWAVAGFIFLHQSPEENKHFQSAIKTYLNTDINDLAYIGSYLYPNIDHGYFSNPRSFIGFYFMASMVILSVTATMYYGSEYYEEMRKYFEISADQAEHNRVYYALLIEASIGIILLHIPFSMMIITALVGFKTQIMANILSTAIAIYPVVDTLSTIRNITVFRTTVMDLLGFFRNMKKEKKEEQSMDTFNTIT